MKLDARPSKTELVLSARICGSEILMVSVPLSLTFAEPMMPTLVNVFLAMMDMTSSMVLVSSLLPTLLDLLTLAAELGKMVFVFSALKDGSSTVLVSVSLSLTFAELTIKMATVLLAMPAMSSTMETVSLIFQALL
jgi:hypothetical protein